MSELKPCTTQVTERLIGANALMDEIQRLQIFLASKSLFTRAIKETILRTIDEQPTVGAPENNPLTLDQLKRRNFPVWVPLEDGTGYWCLCQNGMIVPPSGLPFMAEDRPNWKFLDRNPEQEGGK